jgi:hypothetical protein
MPNLTAQTAQITTATVEIQTLTISRKQVTLAVFRQLPEEPLIADDGTLNGVPWGTVNYHPDKCADRRSHRHVVWQRGATLLRSLVFDPMNWGYFESPTGIAFVASHCRDLLEERPSPFFNGLLPRPRSDGGHRYELILEHKTGVTTRVSPTGKVFDLWRLSSLNAPENRYQRDRWCKDLIEQADMIVGPSRRETTTLGLHQQLEEEIHAEAQRRQRHMDARATFRDLPQLFIAV